jgi:hypothetical protein
MLYRFFQLREREMIDAVHVPGPKGDGGDAARHGFRRNRYNMGKMPLPVADEVQSLRPRILAPVTPERPFARNAGVKNGASAVDLPENRSAGRFAVHDRGFAVDLVILLRFPEYNNVGLDDVVTPQGGGKLRMQSRQVFQLEKVFILFKSRYGKIPGKNPFSRAEMGYFRKTVPEKRKT